MTQNKAFGFWNPILGGIIKWWNGLRRRLLLSRIEFTKIFIMFIIRIENTQWALMFVCHSGSCTFIVLVNLFQYILLFWFISRVRLLWIENSWQILSPEEKQLFFMIDLLRIAHIVHLFNLSTVSADNSDVWTPWHTFFTNWNSNAIKRYFCVLVIHFLFLWVVCMFVCVCQMFVTFFLFIFGSN